MKARSQSVKAKAIDDTRLFREYMVKEALQQYQDFYETDAEEAGFFEYMQDMSNRDKIRFAEIFKDHTQLQHEAKEFILIPKREHNPEISAFSNLLLDFMDFKDRVRPLAKDVTLIDVVKPY